MISHVAATSGTVRSDRGSSPGCPGGAAVSLHNGNGFWRTTGLSEHWTSFYRRRSVLMEASAAFAYMRSAGSEGKRLDAR